MSNLRGKLNFNNVGFKAVVGFIAVVILGLISGGGIMIGLDLNKGEIVVETEITFAGTQVPAMVENEEGEVELVDVPTVEAVDAPITTKECGEDEECGRGWWVDISSPTTFKNATFGQCIDTDGYYGSQCWDLANLFWQNAAGRTLSTWGTGAAKGTILDGAWQYNAGDEFVMVWNPEELRAGDFVVFTNGEFGHIGMAMGGYNNGYVSLLGTNQGGAGCNGGGSAANIINISLKYFGGAFRYKEYIVPEPVIPEPVTEEGYIVREGDTLGEITLREGWYSDLNGLFGDEGYTQKLAEKNGIENRGLIYPGQKIVNL